MPYIGRTVDGFGVRNRFVYLASASDTSVSGADANGATLTFTDGAYVDVYLNGVLLKPGTDYNTTTANTIAGISAMAANDEVTVVVYDVFTVGDMVSATSGGTFNGGVNIDGAVTINESSADVDFRVESNGNANMLFVDGGNDAVVISDSTSRSVNSAAHKLQVSHTDYNCISAITYKAGSDGAALTLGKSRNGTIGSNTVVNSGDTLGVITFVGADGTDINTQGARISAEVDGTPGGNDLPTRLVFRTSEDGTASPTERMRINNVGGLKAFADGTTTQSALTDQVHEFAHASSDKDHARFGVSNTSYGNNGVNIGVTRGSSTSYNTLATHHGNDGSDRYSDRTFQVRGDGQIFSDASTSITLGSDYAEFFEWKDGNSSSEDRIGHSVVLDGNKIRKATSSDSTSNILGVISGNPSIVGDTAELRWHGKWELDDFMRKQTEEVEVWEWKDDDGVFHSYGKHKVPEGLTVPSNKTVKKVVNDKYSSSYDESKKDSYVPRSQRKEWDAVGLLGKLRILKGQPTGDRWIKMRDISDTVEEWLVR